MNLQRLKFAWARGARIEIHVAANTWSHMSGESFLNLGGTPDYRYRIHPDNAHLEYGPLSSALLALADRDGRFTTEMEQLACRHMSDTYGIDPKYANLEGDDQTWRTLCRFEAELLADEGL